MRYIERKIILLLCLIAFCIISGAFIPSLGEFYLFFLELLWNTFSKYYLKDEVINILLFVVVGVIMFGSVYLTNKQESRVWEIVKVIMTIGGIISLFVFKKLL